MKVASLFPAANQLVQAADDILLFTHVTPDGDAIGSLSAAGQAMEQLGKRVVLACEHETPERFRFLPLTDRIVQIIPPERKFDLIIALDCGDEERIGDIFTTLQPPLPPILNIDHHVTNTMFGAVNLVDDANATVEILYALFPALGVSLTPGIATSLLAGLITDTLGFRTAGVTGQTLQVAGELVDAGANLSETIKRALLIKPYSTLLLWQKGLNNMRLEDSLIWTRISRQERQAVGHEIRSSGGLGNLLLEVEQAAVSLVLLEMDDGQVYAGFRAQPPYDVSQLAVDLGGGGHPLAAGCTRTGSLDEVASHVVALTKETIQQQKQ